VRKCARSAGAVLDGPSMPADDGPDIRFYL
jgi:hypothetical protein